MFQFSNIEMNLIKKQTNFIIFVFLKMEYFVFKVEEKIRSVSSENFQPHSVCPIQQVCLL